MLITNCLASSQSCFFQQCLSFPKDVHARIDKTKDAPKMGLWENKFEKLAFSWCDCVTILSYRISNNEVQDHETSWTYMDMLLKILDSFQDYSLGLSGVSMYIMHTSLFAAVGSIRVE